MAVFNNILAGASGQTAGGAGYEIERSLRFNSSDSAYCGKSFSTDGTDRKKLSFSFWVKLCSSSAVSTIISGFDGSSAQAAYWQFNSGGAFSLSLGGASSYGITTTAVFRDPSAWYHFLVSIDTTIASPSSDRIKLYVNGAQVTTFAFSSYPTQNYEVELLNAGRQTNIGVAWNTGYGGYLNGYLADVHFIDGQALTPSSFGEFDTNGVWQPIAYAGSYGTNGFHLPFSDNSTAAALGTDTSGNSNTWTVNNISVTAGAANDSLVDSPTNGTQTDTGVGGEVVGNYCTWNPLANGAGTLSNGNLDLGNSGPNTRCNSTISVSSGKWYYEITLNTLGTNSSAGIGQNQITNAWPGNDALSYAFELDNARTAQNGSLASYGSALTAGNIFMCAFDLDNSKIFFGKDGTWFNSSNPATGTNPAFTLAAGSYCPIGRPYGGGSFSLNAGQRPFAYTAPSGFKALCTANLPEPTIADGSTVMDVLTWTGTGGGRTLSGLNFSPDLVWGKSRSAAYNHQLYDVIRGAGNANDLSSSLTAAEGSATVAASQYGYLSAFTSNGFTVANGTDGSFPGAYWNASGTTYAAWTWDAGSSTVTNTDGSITSQVRANPSAGFSVVTFNTGTAGNKTIGHGLGVAPGMILFKNRVTSPTAWAVYHIGLSSPAYQQYLVLNETDAESGTDTRIWADTAPSSTVFSIESGYITNASNDCVAYCFAPVDGYSSFGSFSANNSSDGNFIYLGFRPRWIMTKQTSGAGGNWFILDTARNTYNVMNNILDANLSDAERNANIWDATANGMKLRIALSGDFIYAAFAEHPFSISRAR